MNGVERQRFALKAYRLAEMTKDDWKKLKLSYSQLSKEWWLIPTFIWYVLFFAVLLAGVILEVFDSIPFWFQIVGGILFIYSLWQIVNRKGNLEGFQYGYEMGKRDGVCKALGIKQAEQEKLLGLARSLITEFKVETGDPDFELGKNMRDSN